MGSYGWDWPSSPRCICGKLSCPTPRTSGRPYSHFHDWSIHTHYHRPKGGRHYRAVRRRQRPWRVGFWVILVAGLIVAAVMLVEDWSPALGLLENAGAAATTAGDSIGGMVTEREVRTVAREQLRVSDLEQRVHVLVNVEREQRGVHGLEWDSDLGRLARAHSDDMVARRYFSHDTLEGFTPTDRLHRAGLSCRRGMRNGIAENLTVQPLVGGIWRPSSEMMGTEALDELAYRLTGGSGSVAEKAVQGWVNSPRHFQNMTGGNYGTTGIGVTFGTWNGVDAVYVTQVFC